MARINNIKVNGKSYLVVFIVLYFEGTLQGDKRPPGQAAGGCPIWSDQRRVFGDNLMKQLIFY